MPTNDGEYREVSLMAGQIMIIERPGLPDVEVTFTGCHGLRGRMQAYDSEGRRYRLKPTGTRNRFRLTMA